MSSSIIRNEIRIATVIVLGLIFLGLSVTSDFRGVGDTQDADNGRSIILMIGDGMGFEQVKLGRWTEVGENNQLALEQLPHNRSVITKSANAEITDSAAAATAMATGVKTNNGMIAVDTTRTSLETILEIAQYKKKSTGIVSTTYIQHATPAAFMTHVSSRNELSEITRQIVEEASVDVLLGGGLSYFSSDQILEMIDDGYDFVQNRTELGLISSSKVLGLFANGYMDYEQNRNNETTPSLAEMTEKAIDVLSSDSDGFFLMVEGGRIDHGGHANNKIDVALETIAFDKAVEVALNYVETNSNTILIITADHETGGLLVIENTLNDDLPSREYSSDHNLQLRINRTENVTVSWTTTGHTSTNVPFYITGFNPEEILSESIIDNTDIFDLMNISFTDSLNPPFTYTTWEPPTESTTTSTTSPIIHTTPNDIETDDTFPTDEGSDNPSLGDNIWIAGGVSVTIGVVLIIAIVMVRSKRLVNS